MGGDGQDSGAPNKEMKEDVKKEQNKKYNLGD